jgi:hypothetical protein
MHAFAGDYFGALYQVCSATPGCTGTPDSPKGPNCAVPLIEQQIKDANGASRLASPDHLVIPALIDLHAGIANGATPTDPPDPNTAKTFFNDVYSLVTSSHSAIKSGQPQFKMPLTLPYPVIMGETFTTQTKAVCPDLAPEEQDYPGGAQDEFAGYQNSDLYRYLGVSVIFRPWHFLDANCPTPSQIGPPLGPYRPYPSQ